MSNSNINADLLSTPVHPGPTGAAVIIAAGAGGVDAHDTALAIAEMIENYALKLGFSVYDRTEQKPPEGPGILNATFAVAGNAAFASLVELTGVHRVNRISPHDPEGRLVSSFALVTIAPLVAWGSLRYSYTFSPETQARNYQTGSSAPDVESVMAGNLDLILSSPETAAGAGDRTTAKHAVLGPETARRVQFIQTMVQEPPPLAKLIDDACAASYWHGESKRLGLPGVERIRSNQAGLARNALCAALGITPETPWEILP